MIARKLNAIRLTLPLILFACGAVVAQTNNYSTRLFPTPEVLKPNVEFWKNIYAKYSEREVVLHDSEDLGIVYEVINLDELFRGLNVSPRLQWRKIGNIKKQYRAILLGLSKRPDLKLENLRGKERHVAAQFGANLNAARLRRAAGKIRAQTGLKERFELGLMRSGLYVNKMREIFQEEGLPLELLVLPHVESSFNYKAYSKMGAAGLWQFTRATGRMYMTVDYHVDERLDPVVATESAASHLSRNYRELGSWPLAITAYNHGLYGMKRAKSKYGNDIGRISMYYQSRSFGFASRNFYSEFLAALEVSSNYKKYFGEIEFHKPRDYMTFPAPDYITVQTLTKALEIEISEFAEFNPALRPPVLKSERRIPKYYQVRVPLRQGVDIETLYAKISPEQKFSEQVTPEWHKVRSGENLSVIAKRYGVSTRDLMVVNGIRNPHRIHVGQNLQVPSNAKFEVVQYTPTEPPATLEETQLAEATDLTKTSDGTVLDAPPTSSVSYPIADTKPAAAKPPTSVKVKTVPNTDVARSKMKTADSRLNHVTAPKTLIEASALEEEMELALPDHQVELTRSMDVRIVQIPQQENLPDVFREIAFPENGQVIVETDETLGHFADWLGVSAQRVRDINGLGFSQHIRVGKPLWLTFENVTPEEFHRRRVEYHHGIEEDFYRNYNVDGEKLHRIGRGENIWFICNRVFEIPYWLVQKYNPGKDLTRLMAGEEIVVPIVEDKQMGIDPAL